MTHQNVIFALTSDTTAGNICQKRMRHQQTMRLQNAIFAPINDTKVDDICDNKKKIIIS
jgi:hypothetical protein